MKSPKSRAIRISEYLTKELSKKTWLDFERLFQTHPAPGAYPCWCMHDHLSGGRREGVAESAASRVERTHQRKKALVEGGCSHGILVYLEGEPVGWCQYGRREELPRIEWNPYYRKLTLANDQMTLWRITCFVVRRQHRHRGVASAALSASLVAIRNQGGGLVEAYPIRHWSAYSKYRGTVAMFRKQGFKVIGPLGKNNVLVRRIV